MKIAPDLWKKEVALDWGLWLGNLLPVTAPAASDGYSIFLEAAAGDGARYRKIRDARSIYRVRENLVLDTTGAVPLRLNAVADVREWQQDKHGRAGGLALKWLAIFETVDRHKRTVLLNAQRLRIAALITTHEHCWLGADGLVYVCDREETGLDLFGEAPRPLAAIAPMLEPYEMLREYQRYEREHRT